MAIRTSLLNGNNITRDTDFSKYIETVSEAGVIRGLAVSSSSVAIGQARVPCERTNGETIFSLVTITTPVSISGDGDVYIEVSQTYIDNGELANEDGTGIATISVGTMPAKNALKLATKNGSTITDARNMIKKVGELNTAIGGLITRMTQAEADIEALEEASAIERLEQSGLAGELYSLSDQLFRQYTPKLADCIYDINVGDTNANKQIHIQRIGSGTANNQIKLKVKKVGSPTTALYVEVRKGVQVTVTANKEAYWYGDSSNIIATANKAYTNFSSDYAEITFTMSANFGGTKGELLDVVVYQANNTVNADNYYSLAVDSTQYSEGFSCVSVNGTTRVRWNYMPYCISSGFVDTMLCKYGTTGIVEIASTTPFSKTNKTNVGNYRTSATVKYTAKYKIKVSVNVSADYCQFYLAINGQYDSSSGKIVYYGNGEIEWNVNLTAGDYIVLQGLNSDTSGVTVNYIGVSLIPTIKPITLIPLEVVSLGNLTSGVSFGEVNGEFKGGQFVRTDTSATAGSITLGNAVGYLVVNYQGQELKIPYYS